MIIYRRTEAEWRCCWRDVSLEIMILRRPKLRLDLKLELLADVGDSIVGVGNTV